MNTKPDQTTYLFQCATAIAGDMFTPTPKAKIVSAEEHLQMARDGLKVRWSTAINSDKLRILLHLIKMTHPLLRVPYIGSKVRLKQDVARWCMETWMSREDGFDIAMKVAKDISLQALLGKFVTGDRPAARTIRVAVNELDEVRSTIMQGISTSVDLVLSQTQVNGVSE